MSGALGAQTASTKALAPGAWQRLASKSWAIRWQMLLGSIALSLACTAVYAGAVRLWDLDGVVDLSLAAVVGLTFGIPSFAVGRYIDELRAHALSDALTGVANRRFTRQRLEQELARAQRTRGPLSVLAIDVNDLKLINDSLGHSGGDTALRIVARAVSQCVRASDTVGRDGGDEFVVIAPETDESAAHSLAQRISASVVAAGRKATALRSSLLSVSIGAATTAPDVATADRLLVRADRAMYRAKHERARAPDSPLQTSQSPGQMLEAQSRRLPAPKGSVLRHSKIGVGCGARVPATSRGG